MIDLPRLVAFDTETFLIQPGLLAPQIVCGSICSDPAAPQLLDAAGALAWFSAAVRDGRTVIGGANVFYDLGVCCAADPSLVPDVFCAVDEGRVVCTHVLEALHDVGRGVAYQDGGRPFERYSLALLERRYLARDRSEEKSGEDAWRLRYGTLVGVPLEQWPQEAKDYPLRDAEGTYRVLCHQLTPEVRTPQKHDLSFGSVCVNCGEGDVEDKPCPDHVARRLNLHVLIEEIRAGWWLHLASMWGLRTDPVMVESVITEWKAQHEENRRRFFDVGLIRVKPCGEDEQPDDIDDAWLAAMQITLQRRSGESWIGGRLDEIAAARRALGRGRRLRFAADTVRLAELVDRAYKSEPPRTDTGRVSCSRDTLGESGDELLEEYGKAGPGEKEYSTYAEVLRQGAQMPINPEVSLVKVTQRMSTRRPNLQNLPRKGKTRECFVPRPGWLFFSLDYSQQELVALSYVCLKLFGHSVMADAINAGQDLHTRLGARVLGIEYEEAMRRKGVGDAQIKAVRQAMKPVNFGKPGLMGPPKMVFTARKDGVVFCELAGRGTCRSHPRVVEWGKANSRRPIPPTCEECLALAAEYSDLWYTEWPEMREYHELTVEVARRCEDGEPLESVDGGIHRLESGANAVSNHFFQNLAARCTKRAGWLVSREAYCDPTSVLYENLRICVGVHDELFGEVREEVASEAAWRACEVMRGSMQERVPGVKVSLEPALMRRWFKGAERLERDGSLKPWWPEGWDWPADREAMERDRA